MQKTNQWIIIFFFLALFGVTVVYAAERDTQPDFSVETMKRTGFVTEDMEEREQIRMANEDAIEVSAMTDTNSRKLSEKEYAILTRIVEAEATSKDMKSKILVANVVLNRVKHKDFPDTIEDVVFQKVGRAVQFSPVADGRYYKVSVTEETKESVDRALAGEDYSKGALYFMERSLSDPDNVSWFDRALTRLFEYEGHEFYR